MKNVKKITFILIYLTMFPVFAFCQYLGNIFELGKATPISSTQVLQKITAVGIIFRDGKLLSESEELEVKHSTIATTVLYNYYIEVLPKNEENSIYQIIEFHKFFGDSKISVAFDPEFISAIKPIPNKYPLQYKIRRKNDKFNLYVQVMGSPYSPLHCVITQNINGGFRIFENLIKKGITVNDTGNTWTKTLYTGSSDGYNSDFFYLLSPLVNSGYEVILCHPEDFVNQNGFINGESVAIEAKKNGHYYILKGTIVNSHFEGSVFFGKKSNDKLTKTGVKSTYQLVEYLYFDEFGVLVSNHSNILMNLLSCSSQYGIGEIIENPILGSIVSETISSYLTGTDFSVSKVGEGVLTNEVVKKLKESGYDSSANSIKIASFISCLLN